MTILPRWIRQKHQSRVGFQKGKKLLRQTKVNMSEERDMAELRENTSQQQKLKVADLVVRTGYFAQAARYAQEGYALVSIALKPAWFLPKEVKVVQLQHLAPTLDLLALRKRPDIYTLRYRDEILGKLDAYKMLMRLRRIAEEANTNKVVLMCWEAPGKFCHRHLVAHWLRKATEIQVCEFSSLEKQALNKPRQATML